MAFTVPDIEPPRPTGLMAGDWIKSSSMTTLVERDRFLFATRRRVIASLPKVTTNSSGSYAPTYAFDFKTLPTATDTLVIGFVSTGACSVRVIYSMSVFAVLTTTGPESMVGWLTGVPINTWSRLLVEVKSNSGSPVTIHGIYIAEKTLSDTDLP